MTRVRTFLAVLATALIGVLALSPAAASASEHEPVDPEIAAVLAEVPGGIVIDANHAVWPALDLTMTVPTEDRSAALSSVGPCSTGRVCAFSGSSLSGSQLSWGTCGYHSVPSTFTVRSIADARSSGSLQALSGSTVLATVYAGGWANVSGTTTRLRCIS